MKANCKESFMSDMQKKNNRFLLRQITEQGIGFWLHLPTDALTWGVTPPQHPPSPHRDGSACNE